MFTLYSSSYSLLTLQPCVDLGLLHSFVTLNSSGMGSLTSNPTSNLEDQGLRFVWALPLDLSGMDGATRSLLSRQHSSLVHWGEQTSSPRYGDSPRRGYSRVYVYTYGEVSTLLSATLLMSMFLLSLSSETVG
jgi:hypothetical protein